MAIKEHYTYTQISGFQLAFLFGTQEPGYFSYKDNNSWDSKSKICVVIQLTQFQNK